jgi:transposase
MRIYAKAWPDRVWAVEGANGTGRPLAQRLLEAGENVVDVPAKLAARVRLFNTGQNRKTDALDARSIAIVAVRTKGLRVLKVDGELQALRLLTDRREALTRRRVQTVNRLQALLAELLPGQAKKDITPLQAKAMLARVRPRDIAGKTRRSITAEELAELVAVDAKITKATAELKTLVLAPRLHSAGCGSGRAMRGVSRIQRGRLTPAHQHLASATSRTRTPDATPGRETPKDRQQQNARSGRLTTEGRR